MAILWEQTLQGVNYQVRAAGHTRRLYTDGVFHSQYNPNQIVSGGVWDLLMLPAFFYPKGEIRRVLVLGVGGGAVMHMLHHFVKPEALIGVELNPVHLDIARQYFRLEEAATELHQADAVDWVSHYRGPAFDMIIDDLFGEQDGEPKRAVAANAKWFDSLLRLLSPAGLLVTNFVETADLYGSAYFTNQRIRKRFNTAYRLSLPDYENQIGVFLRRPATSADLLKHLREEPALDPGSKSNKVRYRICRLGAG